MLESDHADQLLFVIENACRVTAEAKIAFIGDLFFRTDGVYWIEYASFATNQNTNATSTGVFIGGIVGGAVGAMIDAAKNKETKVKIRSAGLDKNAVKVAMPIASKVRDGQYGYSMSERLKLIPKSKAAFNKSMKSEDIRSIELSPGGVMLTFTLAHDAPFEIFPAAITDAQRDAIASYIANEPMEAANDKRYGFQFSALSPAKLMEMFADRTPVEASALNLAAQDETYMKGFYGLLYKQKRAKRMAVCEGIYQQAPAFRDSLLSALGAERKKKLKSGVIGTSVFTIILMGFVILIDTASKGEGGVTVYAISLSICALIILLFAIRPARKAKNISGWLQ